MFYDKNKTAKEYQQIVDDLYKKINDPKLPQGELDDLNYKLHNARHNLKIAKRQEYEKKQNVSVYGSDDYVGCHAGDYELYFGYEVTKCPIKSHKTEEDCYEKDCDKREWVFQVTKNNEVIFEKLESEITYPESDTIERQLIVGICHFIKSLTK